ncbi:ABC transporter permease [Maribacter halichondriae]|uniref:ABC transporter permease n=1 Tax=Maribacter halichondriae TaxID=2980554 RepID=UPI0023595453|nr:ABC transporter permease [Maribacter sp. Hal144]
MYKLFLKIATRYLLKNKLYSFINIAGLSIGIASFVLIMLYVNYEKSYDTFEGSQNVFRVYMDYTEDGVFVPGDAQTYNLSGPTLKEAFPEIKEYARFYHITDIIFKPENAFIEGEKGALADPSVFEVLKYQLVKGDINTVLKEPFTILLTESLARKIFGDQDPMGKSLPVNYGGNTLFTVNGILRDTPKNTHIKNDFLISFNTFLTWDDYGEPKEFNWNGNTFFTYIQIDENADADILKKKIMDFKVEALPFERHNIEPLEDIHLYSDKPYEVEANGSGSRVGFLMAIAFIIIVLSWLNYINLSTTKSLERAKETGIRKVAGAQRPQIIVQSLLESLLLNLIAITVAMFLVLILLPIFNNYVRKELALDFSSFGNVLFLLSFILLGTLLSGIYPAIVLSNYTPAKALKGKISTSPSGLNIRKALIIGQFLATIILLIGTIVVTKQINFLQEQPIGAELNQVLALSGNETGNASDSLIWKDFKTLKNELRNLPFISSTELAQTYPGDAYHNLGSNVGITFPDGRRDDSRIWYNYATGPEYFQVMGMEFVAGGPFLENTKGQANSIVINEQLAKHMGIVNMEGVVGKTVKFFGEDWLIAGVLKNYHHFGLKTAIEPIIVRYANSRRNLLVKLDKSALSTKGLNAAIAQIEGKWKEILPEFTFNYTFLDQKFEAQYKEDKAFGIAFQVFTILAILIASMGLFGLTSYTILQRKKEIGIRKVNGATIGQVLTLLNKDFVKWVGLAFIIAVPISWYAMSKWLEGFAYKTTMSWWIFALAGISALVIALLTVSWQSFRAAVANPVEALRDE